MMYDAVFGQGACDELAASREEWQRNDLYALQFVPWARMAVNSSAKVRTILGLPNPSQKHCGVVVDKVVCHEPGTLRKRPWHYE